MFCSFPIAIYILVSVPFYVVYDDALAKSIVFSALLWRRFFRSVSIFGGLGFLPQLSGEGGTTLLSLHEAPVFTRLPSHTYSDKCFFCSVLESFCSSCPLPVVSGLEILMQMS